MTTAAPMTIAQTAPPQKTATKTTAAQTAVATTTAAQTAAAKTAAVQTTVVQTAAAQTTQPTDPPIDSRTVTPSFAPIVFGTTGVAYLAVDTALESVPPSAVAQVRSQVREHLSQYSQYYSAGLRDAHFALNVMSGSVVIEVTVSGEQVDGATLARLLESDVGTRRLKMTLAIGYAPKPSQKCCCALLLMLWCLQWGVVACHLGATAI